MRIVSLLRRSTRDFEAAHLHSRRRPEASHQPSVRTHSNSAGNLATVELARCSVRVIGRSPIPVNGRHDLFDLHVGPPLSEMAGYHLFPSLRRLGT